MPNDFYTLNQEIINDLTVALHVLPDMEAEEAAKIIQSVIAKISNESIGKNEHYLRDIGRIQDKLEALGFTRIDPYEFYSNQFGEYHITLQFKLAQNHVLFEVYANQDQIARCPFRFFDQNWYTKLFEELNKYINPAEQVNLT